MEQPVTQQSSSNSEQNYRSNSRQYVQCQLCQKFGHTADVCRSKSQNHFEAKANFASSSWILDSGATHHLTTEPYNLEESTGNEGISMGDGKTIPITHTGSTLIQVSNSAFRLCNTMCSIN